MADDVPVSDVLVEAMEYLSKLGSNLRTRSENLKDKRIRRDKLKNAHAVQKAAQKVLLICELSKKSLENVESGVKKVLQLVDKSQASIGVGGNADKSSPGDKTSKPSSSEKDYKYFRYRSCKLKIRKKISVKHYMSVKVLARQLPKTMQDKYPVYYNCKLYRSRKRSELKDKELSKSSKRMSKEDSHSDEESSKKGRKDSIDELDVEKTEKKTSIEESHSQEKIDDTSSKNKEDSDSERERQQIRERKKSSMKSKNDDSKERQKECKKSLLEDSESDKESQDMEKSKSKQKSAEKRKSDDFDKLKKKEKDTKRDESDRTNFDVEKLKKERRKSTVIESDSDDISEKSKGKKKSTIVDSDSEREIKKKSQEKKKSLLEDSESDKDSQDMEKSKSKEKSAEKRKSDDFDKLKKKDKDTKRDESDRTNFDVEKLKKERRKSTVIESNSGDISEKSKEMKKSAIVDSDSEREIKKKSKEKKKSAIVESDSEDDTKKDNEYSSEKSMKTFEKDKSEKLSANERNKRILSTDSESSQKESKKEHGTTAEDKSEKQDSHKKERHKNPDKESKSKEKERTSNSSRRSGSTENSHKRSKDNTEDTNPNDNENCKKKESEKKADFIDLSSDDENSKSKKEEKTEDKKENNSATSKSIIKCVSLTKLLKPDILPLVMPEIKKQDEEAKTNKVKQKKTVRYQDEEEFWAKKRAEVKAFKSKDFSIVIKRLPVVNVDVFLQTHNIKRITQGEKVIHEIGEKNNESEIASTGQEVSVINNKEKHSQDNTKENHAIEWPDISQVKTALLIDSDSDDNVPDKGNEQNTVQTESNIKDNAKENNVYDSENKTDDQSDSNIVSHSDSVKNKEDGDGSSPTQLEVEENVSKNEDNQETTSKSSDKETTETTSKSSDEETIENTRKSSDKEIAETTSKSSDKETTAPCEEDPEAVKSALLNESSNSTPPSPNTPQSKRRKLSETTPKSNRKRIMESMHAKKMLLTYSSSSETEDENLKKVFKNIKQALLKEGSSDEEASKKDEPSQEKHSGSESDVNKKRRREQLSSDSGDDILEKVKRLKKKRKTKRRSKSGSSSPAKEEEKNGKSSQEAGDNVSIDSTIDQVDGTMDEQSNSSNSKMGRSKEKAGSSQNSDAPDDKDIDGLTNLSTLNQTRRRRDSAEGPSSRRKRNMPKRGEPLIKGQEGLVEADMTDDESGAESEGGVEEDLPPVSLSGLNGGGIGELAKDDLLGESDSSSTNEKDQQSEDNAKKEESSSEDQIKLKRRKLAISSDSEAGSSRRKRNEDADIRLSDFEDSEAEEGSEPVKKSKRKKKVDSDDGSQASSSEEGKKKRRRIKQIDDSDASGSDSDNDGKNKHGRKNIRKVMGKNQLEEATKKAARQEKERLARIAERQKLYNNLAFDESGKPDEVVLDKVVLDFDPETKEPLIQVDRGLVKKLKPHQANGIKFMWDACFESVKRIKKDKGSGCILAHCMGLGKTLQVVSLTHTLLTHGELTKVERVLVVCPLSTVLNWVSEFNMWLKHADTEYEVDVYELSRFKQNSERAYQLSQWYKHGGVCVLGYEMFRNLSADNTKKYKKKMLKTFQEALVDPGPDLVVCDEGHLLKNEKTSLSQSMNRVRTLRRIVLTGTPLQNNLKEYYCMVQFVKPNLLGKYNEYLNRFVNPITNGQYTDSTEHDIRVMKRRSHVLHKMLDGAVQRRDYGVLAPFLPPKHEYVLFITLSEVQIKLYQHYLENYSRRPLAGKSSGFLFPDFQSLQRIWTHPLVLKYNSERYEIMQQKKRDKEEEDSEGSLADFIDDDSTPEETSTDESSDDLSDLSDDSHKKSKKKKKEAKKSKAKEAAASRRRGTRANPVEMEDEEVKDLDQIEGRNDNPTEWWIPLVTDDELDDVRNSHKLLLLLEILRQCEAIGDKLLVFSQSLYSLDLIEHFLGKIDEATQDGRVDDKLGGHVGSWSPGIDYFRLDGSTSCENRSIWCKNFNREDNPRARLFLISTRAGGLGINLVAANRVVIFDVSWNPSHDVQSIFRVYRFGQKKPCYIYRFLAMGTMEEKIYERQVTKQAISKRVIDEQQIDRHYAENDLAELYKFEPTPPSPRPVPPVPKDRLFAEIMKQHEDCIYKFHEHDSLLENKEEETLTEEERKAAWEDFENEKNRPPPAPFANVWPPNGMAGLLAQQQQQQLAFAALASMLRKDMPALTEDQIRGMLPLIYSSNPGLMQKLNDIYKYPQASMMNPAAMMNPVAAAAAAGSGSAGLQYEPPWAREQQQQQQMRLQQLLQHQNMGAKYYAGGLGSRDPVAMALQQQRAREIMVGDRGPAGRPRGRPALQPRGPAPDVVTLDSD